jgi:molybdenum cofactor synthesis domain-containing protein
MIRAAVITLSTSRAERSAEADGSGERDLSGDLLAEFAVSLGATAIDRELLPDDPGLLRERLIHWADDEGVDLILTTGGTGFSPSDQTPEATAAVIDRQAPGVAEAIRQEAARHTRHWALSRGIAGMRGATLIVNLPGSPKGVEQSAAILLPILPHALDLISGRPAGH